MKVLLLNPRWAFVSNDLAGSGIPYWPISLSIFKTELEFFHEVHIIDLVAESIDSFETQGNVLLQGADPSTISKSYFCTFEVIVIYAMNFAGYEETVRTIIGIREKFKGQILVLQNTQAVTGYGFTPSIIAEFKSAGADDVITGNPKVAAETFLNVRSQKISNREISFSTSWTKKQIQSYNSLLYSHGPKDSNFVPILTSFGCPFGCDFCVVPSNNARKWFFKNPLNVLEEMEEYYIQYGISHFQIEDLNPTVDWQRWEELVRILIADGRFTYAIVSGTKAETLPVKEIHSLYSSGCRYISISPESGSPRLMKIIGKHFDHEHGVNLVRQCSRTGIRIQACFLIGHPSENLSDKLATLRYIFRLTLAGVDELAFFTIAPHPGSALYDNRKILSNPGGIVTFSGHGRKLDLETKFWRKFLILFYVLMKLIRPINSIKAFLRMVQNHPQTKTENVLARAKYIRKNS